MKLEHIQDLLQIMCDFNTSYITHTFTIGEKDVLVVKCIKGTYILEVAFSKSQRIEYYTSINEAAAGVYKEVNSFENY